MLTNEQVYVTIPHPSPNDNTIRSFDRIYRMKQEAELVWVPESWNKVEVQLWNNLSSRERLCRISALAGHIDDNVPVLPFSINYYEEKLSKPRITGLTTQLVTVLLAPQPYIGSTKDMRAVCQEGWKEGINGINDWTFTAQDGWESFEYWKVDGLQGVLQEMEKIWEGKSVHETRMVVSYGAVRRSLLRAGHDLTTVAAMD